MPKRIEKKRPTASKASQQNHVDILGNLPDELAIYVLGFVPNNSFDAISLVCLNYWRLANDQVLWKWRCEEEFGADFIGLAQQNNPAVYVMCYRELWRYAYKLLEQFCPPTHIPNIEHPQKNPAQLNRLEHHYFQAAPEYALRYSITVKADGLFALDKSKIEKGQLAYETLQHVRLTFREINEALTYDAISFLRDELSKCRYLKHLTIINLCNTPSDFQTLIKLVNTIPQIKEIEVRIISNQLESLAILADITTNKETNLNIYVADHWRFDDWLQSLLTEAGKIPALTSITTKTDRGNVFSITKDSSEIWLRAYKSSNSKSKLTITAGSHEHFPQFTVYTQPSKLSTIIKNNHALTGININSDITSQKLPQMQLLSTISGNNNIHYLNIEGLSLKKSDVFTKFMGILDQYYQLTSLALVSHNLTTEQTDRLFKFIETNTTITALTINLNNDTIQPLLNFLNRNNRPTRLNLVLNNCCVISEINRVNILQALRFNTFISSINYNLLSTPILRDLFKVVLTNNISLISITNLQLNTAPLPNDWLLALLFNQYLRAVDSRLKSHGIETYTLAINDSAAPNYIKSYAQQKLVDKHQNKYRSINLLEMYIQHAFNDLVLNIPLTADSFDSFYNRYIRELGDNKVDFLDQILINALIVKVLQLASLAGDNTPLLTNIYNVFCQSQKLIDFTKYDIDTNLITDSNMAIFRAIKTKDFTKAKLLYQILSPVLRHIDKFLELGTNYILMPDLLCTLRSTIKENIARKHATPDLIAFITSLDTSNLEYHHSSLINLAAILTISDEFTQQRYDLITTIIKELNENDDPKLREALGDLHFTQGQHTYALADYRSIKPSNELLLLKIERSEQKLTHTQRFFSRKRSHATNDIADPTTKRIKIDTDLTHWTITK